LRSGLVLPGGAAPGDYLDRCETMRAAGADRDWENRTYNSLLAGRYCDLEVVFFDDLVERPRYAGASRSRPRGSNFKWSTCRGKTKPSSTPVAGCN
jgi:hypothetical protein